MNLLKFIRQKTFYKQDAINSINLQSLEEDNEKLFRKVLKKIKWHKIDYNELSQETIEGIDWEFVNFKKARRAKTFDINDVDFDEAEASKTFSFLRRPDAPAVQPISKDDSISYRSILGFANDSVSEQFNGYQLRNEFNDKFWVRYSSLPSSDAREISIVRGEFFYDEYGFMKEYKHIDNIEISLIDFDRDLQVDEAVVAYYKNLPDSTSDADSCIVYPCSVNDSRLTRIYEFAIQSGQPLPVGEDVIDALTKSSVYKLVTSLPEFDQFFAEGDWYIPTADEARFL